MNYFVESFSITAGIVIPIAVGFAVVDSLKTWLGYYIDGIFIPRGK